MQSGQGPLSGGGCRSHLGQLSERLTPGSTVLGGNNDARIFFNHDFLRLLISSKSDFDRVFTRLNAQCASAAKTAKAWSRRLFAATFDCLSGFSFTSTGSCRGSG